MPTGGGGGGGGGLSSVSTDGVTIQGNGTGGSPIAIKAAQTDASLQGAGTVASPLGLLAVSTNSTLAGAGISTSHLGVANWAVTTFIGPTGTGAANVAFVHNNTTICGFVLLAPITFAHIAVAIGGTADSSNNYDIGIYNPAGTLVANIGAQTLPATGDQTFATVQGSQTIQPGLFAFAWTTAAATPSPTLTGGSGLQAWHYSNSYATTSGGALGTPITAITVAVVRTNVALPEFTLY